MPVLDYCTPRRYSHFLDLNPKTKDVGEQEAHTHLMTDPVCKAKTKVSHLL